jgi:NAD(P)-dependent dehydrogenase (short-subunit alcohol dehydrogenase family)
MTPSRPRTWFITGASRGLGRAFTEAALASGDRVVATARDIVDLPEPPTRIVLGSTSFDLVRDISRQRQTELERWEELSRAAGIG